jgi:uncharacterized protein YjdB
MRIRLKRAAALVFALLIGFAVNFAQAEEAKTVTSVILNRTSFVQTVGKTFTLVASVSPIPDSKTKVNWTVSDGSVLRITASGDHYATVQLVGLGQASVTAAVDGYPLIAKSCKVTAKNVSVKSFKLSPNVLRLNPGQSAPVTPAFSPSNATNQSVRYWAVNDLVADLVTVGQDGVVTAATGKSGTAYVKGTTYNNKTGTCKVIVGSVAPSGVQISRKTAVLSKTDTKGLQLIAQALPDTLLDRSVEWSSSDPGIAAVDPVTGLVTPGTKMGTVNIYAKAKGAGNIRAACRVKVMVVRASSLQLSGPTSVNAGEERKITATVSPANTTYNEVTFKSSNENVATIDPDGTLHIAESAPAGSFTITATTDQGRKKASLSIRVRAAEGTKVYRALAIVGFSSPKGSGYLPFVTNGLNGVHDALAASTGIIRYDSVTPIGNLRDKQELKNAITAAFGEAKDSDVSVLYLATHGYDRGYVRTQYGATIYFSDILNCLKNIKGDVVVFMDSCHSGYMYNYAMRAPASSVPLQKTTIICSTAVSTSSAYINYAQYPNLAYDHFTRALTRALGYDMIADEKIDMAADLNSDGEVTLGELGSYLATQVPADIAASKTNYEAKYLVHGDSHPPVMRISDPKLVIAARK